MCYERGRIWTLEGFELITVIKARDGCPADETAWAKAGK